MLHVELRAAAESRLHQESRFWGTSSSSKKCTHSSQLEASVFEVLSTSGLTTSSGITKAASCLSCGRTMLSTQGWCYLIPHTLNVRFLQMKLSAMILSQRSSKLPNPVSQQPIDWWELVSGLIRSANKHRRGPLPEIFRDRAQ